MRVTKFYVGFPPAVVKRTVGDTEYGIGADPAGRIRAHRGHGAPARQGSARLRRGRREGRRAAAARSSPTCLTPALERARRALDSRRPASAADALARLRRRARERHRAGRRRARRVVPQGARPRHRGRRSARLLAAGDVAPHHGDRRRPGRQPDRGVRDPDGLLRRSASPSTCRRPPCNQVQVSSPAERMGLKPGDVVIAAQGKPVKDSQALRKVITTSPTVTLQVRRGGAVRTLGPADAAQGRRPARCSASSSTSAATARCTSARWHSVKLAERGGLAGHEGHRRWRSRTSSRAATAATSRASSASCSSSRRAVGDGLYLEQLALAVALARALQPAAVPAARRRSHPVRADRAPAPQAARARGLRARLDGRHRGLPRALPARAAIGRQPHHRRRAPGP